MNYRHAFHAGNFADVMKHVTLVRVLEYLRTKPAPFRVIDTHAGSGLYDLSGAQASRSGEWRGGIARLLASAQPEAAAVLLAPYLGAVTACNKEGELAVYPGSPILARRFLRVQDRLIACEREPAAAAALARNLHGDRRCKALAIDAWTALNAYVPPKERRGVVLIDPPFEEAADFPRLANAIEGAHRKWPTGIYLIWYPLKEPGSADTLARRLRRLNISKILRAEISLSTRPDTSRLSACGLIIVNPPWTLEGELRTLLPQLVNALAGNGGTSRIDWLAREKSSGLQEQASA
jgi:23S rRNA (adenine2030-N6)-methyltransferase